jgi:hypothetical protein
MSSKSRLAGRAARQSPCEPPAAGEAKNLSFSDVCCAGVSDPPDDGDPRTGPQTGAQTSPYGRPLAWASGITSHGERVGSPDLTLAVSEIAVSSGGFRTCAPKTYMKRIHYIFFLYTANSS